jgi:hypothetical protein
VCDSLANTSDTRVHVDGIRPLRNGLGLGSVCVCVCEGEGGKEEFEATAGARNKAILPYSY